MKTFNETLREQEIKRVELATESVIAPELCTMILSLGSAVFALLNVTTISKLVVKYGKPILDIIKKSPEMNKDKRPSAKEDFKMLLKSKGVSESDIKLMTNAIYNK